MTKENLQTREINNVELESSFVRLCSEKLELPLDRFDTCKVDRKGLEADRVLTRNMKTAQCKMDKESSSLTFLI